MAIIIVGDRGQDGSLLKTIIQNKKKKTKIVRINKKSGGKYVSFERNIISY
jgi:NAD kinase